MKNAFNGSIPRYVLTEQDKLRLEETAPMFDILFKQISPTTYELSVSHDGELCTYELKAYCAHLRLLSELCAITSRWICFHPGMHCAEILFSQLHLRLPRLVQLHKLCKLTSGSR